MNQISLDTISQQDKIILVNSMVKSRKPDRFHWFLWFERKNLLMTKGRTKENQGFEV